MTMEDDTATHFLRGGVALRIHQDQIGMSCAIA